MSRYFYDKSNYAILTWPEVVDLFVDDIKYYLEGDEDTNEYGSYTFENFLDDESENIGELEELFAYDREYELYLDELDAKNILAYGDAEKLVDLNNTLKQLIDQSDYQSIQQAIHDGEYDDMYGNYWYCEQRGQDILFY